MAPFQFELKEIKRRQEEEERLLHREHARPLDRPDAGAEPRSETGSVKSGSEYWVVGRSGHDCVHVFRSIALTEMNHQE